MQISLRLVNPVQRTTGTQTLNSINKLKVCLIINLTG